MFFFNYLCSNSQPFFLLQLKQKLVNKRSKFSSFVKHALNFHCKIRSDMTVAVNGKSVALTVILVSLFKLYDKKKHSTARYISLTLFLSLFYLLIRSSWVNQSMVRKLSRLVNHKTWRVCKRWHGNRPGRPVRKHKCVSNHTGSARLQTIWRLNWLKLELF